MKKELLQGFTARITQASKSELVVIQYEIILEEIKEARLGLRDGDMDTFDSSLKKAQKFISELMITLDYTYAISYDLLSLYLYANKSVIIAMMKKDINELDGVEIVINKLLQGFIGVSKEDTSGPVMQNTQQLYAGLTYGKDSLNETFLGQDSNRGFKA